MYPSYARNGAGAQVHVSQFHKQDDLRLHAESLRDYMLVFVIFLKSSPHIN